jgi:hypothetical protein
MKKKLALLFVVVFVVILASVALYRRGILQRFNAVDATVALDCINSRPVPPNAYRILFIGDSLTMHASTRRLWDHFSGMAASEADRDFVHLVTAHIQSRLGSRPVEIFYDNGGNGKIGPMLDYLRNRPNLQPNLVVLQGGENDVFDTQFQTTYKSLLHFFPRTAVIVLGDWWSSKKSSFEQQEAVAVGYSFINLTALYADSSNSGYAGPYKVKGVAMHPNDKGMNQIAGAISAKFDQLAP